MSFEIIFITEGPDSTPAAEIQFGVNDFALPAFPQQAPRRSSLLRTFMLGEM